MICDEDVGSDNCTYLDGSKLVELMLIVILVMMTLIALNQPSILINFTQLKPSSSSSMIMLDNSIY